MDAMMTTIYLNRDATVIVQGNGDGVGSAREKARELLARMTRKSG